MFDFFKKKKDAAPPAEPQPVLPNETQADDESEYTWLIESMVQFLVSPIWKLNINSYIDENCIIFEDVEENQLEHLKCHKEFVKVTESMLDEFISDFGIDTDTFLKTVATGVNIPEYKEYFEYLFLLDKFLVFKKHMVKRNKELELEALESLKENGGSQWVTDEAAEKKIGLAELEQEKADLDYCIEMSKLQSDEMKKMETEDEAMMAEVMRQSEQLFKEEQVEFERQMEEVKKQSMLEITEIKAPEPEAEPPKPKAEPPKPKAEPKVEPKSMMPDVMPTKVTETIVEKEEVHPLLAKLEEEKRIMEQLTHEKSMPNTSLPPVKASGLPSLGPLRKAPPKNLDVSKWEEKKEEVEKKIENFPQASPVKDNKEDSLKERKARLLAQRQKLLEMKKVQRTEEVKRYEELKMEGGGVQPVSEVKEVNAETKKRSEIYSMMKN